MILLVDCGNTSAKWRIESCGQVLVDDVREPTADFSLLRSTLASGGWPLNNIKVAIANVSGSATRDNLISVVEHACGANVSVHDAQVEKHFSGLTVAYDDLSQLGVDRWLAMLAAYKFFESSILLVTVGTAITIDRVAADGQHDGGLIAPGWRLLKESLANGTNNLGVASTTELEEAAALGDNTADCIRFGVSQMLLSYISSAVRQFGSDSSTKILSGGDSAVVSSCLSLDFEVKENLVLDGLSLYCREKDLQ